MLRRMALWFAVGAVSLFTTVAIGQPGRDAGTVTTPAASPGDAGARAATAAADAGVMPAAAAGDAGAPLTTTGTYVPTGTSGATATSAEKAEVDAATYAVRLRDLEQRITRAIEAAGLDIDDDRQEPAEARGEIQGRLHAASIASARDAARCAYTDDRGRRCPETGGLELHHREAHAGEELVVGEGIRRPAGGARPAPGRARAPSSTAFPAPPAVPMARPSPARPWCSRAPWSR